MALAIKMERVSKSYRLGEIGTGTLVTDIQRWYARIRSKEDPHAKIGEENTPDSNRQSDIVWSLKDVSLDITEGGATGIIGRNGAGKSTLLKLLSRVTSPTTGNIKLKGRIASLLEVGTGFHPDLTGRENVFLNGAILGMRKKEITRKFDEIVDFAGVERFIDTPVKRYSSGMYVRLAFAVAAYLESEILVIDEVLAVGDAAFQRKCISKMQDVSRREGRTVLFVSHNMEAVEALTERSLYLKQGVVQSIGKTDKVVYDYLNDVETFTELSQLTTGRLGDGRARVVKMRILRDGSEVSSVKQGESFDVLLGIQCQDNLKTDMAFVLENNKEQSLFCTHFSDYQKVPDRTGYYEVLVQLNVPHLRNGRYLFSTALFRPDWTEFYDVIQHVPLIMVDGADVNDEFPTGSRAGSLYYPVQWTDVPAKVMMK